MLCFKTCEGILFVVFVKFDLFKFGLVYIIFYIINTMSFTYIGTSDHCEWDSKIGKSSNLYSRENSLECSYSRFAFLFKILIICSCDEQALEIEEYLHKVNWCNSTTRFPDHDGGLEWFDRQFTKQDILQQLERGGFTNEVIDDPLLINNKIEPLKQKYGKKKQEYIRKMVHSSRLEKSSVKPYEIQEKEIIHINID